MSRGRWLDAQSALALLHVRAQTLYANVSRGRIRVRADPEDSRRSLYHLEDVRAWAQRRRGRPRRERLAAGTIAWGDPILPSAISTVAQGRLWYRGQDAVYLAERADLEQIAQLLWEQPTSVREITPGRAKSRAEAIDANTGRSPVQAATPLQAAYESLALRAGRDAPMYGRAAGTLRVEALSLFEGLSRAMLSAIAGPAGPARASERPAPAHTSLHLHLAGAWRRPAAAEAIRHALVLLADHELNASTFATRVAASTGAALSASVLAGFATLSGPMHGGASVAVQSLVEEAKVIGAERAVLALLAQGRVLPAFGHPLYPDMDVRAAAILGQLTVPPVYDSLRAAAHTLVGEAPNVDFALCALTAAYRLPPNAPFVLFALARCVGWIAHALEQHLSGHLIRPRARYIGRELVAPASRSSATPVGAGLRESAYPPRGR